MTTKIQSIIVELTANPKRIFLLDSIGALLTAFLSGAILTRFQDVFGMPQRTLYCLSALASIYAIYSLCCYYAVSSQWRIYLKVVVIANIAYCVLTLGLIFYFYDKLTLLGVIYFMLELLVMTGLVVVEQKTLANRSA